MKNGATCQETQEYLQELMDSTLGPDQGGRLRVHLEACPACAGELQLQRKIRGRVAAELPRREAPVELKRKVREILTPRERRMWGFLPRPALQWGLAVAALIVASLVPITLLRQGGQERVPPILAEAVNDYRSFVMRVNPETVATADRQQVRQWLEARVGFPIEPPLVQGASLRLVGGDVTYFLERKVACLLYGKGPKLVTLLVLRDEGIELPQRGFRQVNGLQVYMASHKGTGVIFWRKEKLLYSLVSEVPPEELLTVALEIGKI